MAFVAQMGQSCFLGSLKRARVVDSLVKDDSDEEEVGEAEAPRDVSYVAQL